MRRGWDANSKWICILCAALLFACGGLWALGRVLPAAPDEETQTDWTLLTLNEARMTLYAQEQQYSGVPWVLLYAIDEAEEVTPDAQRVRTVAQKLLDSGAKERGLFALPIATVADVAGLYNPSRKWIARISTQALRLQDVYNLIASGRYPAQGQTVQNNWHDGGADEAYSTIEQAGEVTAAFSGTVEQVQEGRVVLTTDAGLTLWYDGLQQIDVEPGEQLACGEVLGRAQTLRFWLWVEGQAVNPYPYLLIWQCT